jgi:hypothetical protein
MMMTKEEKRKLPMRTTGSGILCWYETVRRRHGAWTTRSPDEIERNGTKTASPSRARGV